MIEAYPLYWPEGRPRKERWNRENARFDTSFARARDEIVRQIRLLVGKYESDRTLIVSTNIALRRDGLPLAGQRQPDDTGVAVYFDYKKRQVCFACDRWNKIEHNMQAIAKTIDALRGIDRWGTGDMIEAAFKGFTALPSNVKSWRTVLNVPAGGGLADARTRYRSLVSEHHPDRPGGSHDRMADINKAWEEAQRELQ